MPICSKTRTNNDMMMRLRLVALMLLLLHNFGDRAEAAVRTIRPANARPAPARVGREARQLRNRYRHYVRQGSNPVYRERILRERRRRRLETSNTNSTSSQSLRRVRNNRRQALDADDLLELHLFPDEDPELDATAYGSRPFVRQIILECDAEPLYFCPECKANNPQKLEECPKCQGRIIAQQSMVIRAVNETLDYAIYQSTVVSTSFKLINAIYLNMMVTHEHHDDDYAAIDRQLLAIAGVKHILPQEDYGFNARDAVEYIGGGPALTRQFCGVGGKGVKVAVLDSGIDYTHKLLGGEGTKEAYAKAYGSDWYSPENKQRTEGVFPTERVVDGWDFLGENFEHTAESVTSDALPDGNPVDANRHGTMVADAVLSVAPLASLVAYKVCTSDTGTCPGFAVLQALEMALDPNGDGNMDDKVDVVNLSLGGSYLSPKYDLRSEMLERIFQLGIIPVVAAGNEGNIPYIGGPGSNTPNTISVGSTGHPNSTLVNMVADYSSRGPGENNILKPDISAPSNLKLAAAGTGTFSYVNVSGTSFSAPLVAGAVALIKERCPDCSPLAVKAILMNNAKWHIQYHTNLTQLENGADRDDAPASLVGAGELQLEKMLAADFWAYCVEDMQPSLSLGLVHASKVFTIRKTIIVKNLSGLSQVITASNSWLKKRLPPPHISQEEPMKISFEPPEQTLPEGCGSNITFVVTYTVDPTKAPPNAMTSTGIASKDPVTIDINEFGGHIVFRNHFTKKSIGLPYHAIVRQAADVSMRATAIDPPFVALVDKTDNTDKISMKRNFSIGLTNHGAGVAQMDPYELLFVSPDDPEPTAGESAPSDFKMGGYRILPVDQSQIATNATSDPCDYIIEFAFTTWEKTRRLTLEFFQIHVDTDLDDEVDYIVFNSGVFTPYTDNISCLVRNKKTGELKCTGMPPDHGTNTANTVLRVCSNDLGLPTREFFEQGGAPMEINVYFLTATATHLGVTEVTDQASDFFYTLQFPLESIRAPSYDIYPGETLEKIELEGSGVPSNRSSAPLGLMLVNNGYRRPDSTGAAIPESETLVLINEDASLELFEEVTPDEIVFAKADEDQVSEKLACSAWENVDNCVIDGEWAVQSIAGQDHLVALAKEKILSSGVAGGTVATDDSASGFHAEAVRADEEAGPTSKCEEKAYIPRAKALRVPVDQLPTLLSNTTQTNDTENTGNNVFDNGIIGTILGNSTSGNGTDGVADHVVAVDGPPPVSADVLGSTNPGNDSLVIKLSTPPTSTPTSMITTLSPTTVTTSAPTNVTLAPTTSPSPIPQPPNQNGRPRPGNGPGATVMPNLFQEASRNKSSSPCGYSFFIGSVPTSILSVLLILF